MAAAAALFAYFGGILMFFLTERKEVSAAFSESAAAGWWHIGVRELWIAFFFAAVGGLCLSLAMLASAHSALIWLLSLVCFVVTLAAAILVLSFEVGCLSSSRTEGMKPSSGSRRLKATATLAVCAAAFALGTRFGQDDPPPEAIATPYHVAGTETNGSGFVNECPEPAPCAGKSPVGQLEEGAPVSIDCQLKGKRAESASGDVSYIWDRLASENFVSDLFVNTPGAGQFSPGIPRCSPWR